MGVGALLELEPVGFADGDQPDELLGRGADGLVVQAGGGAGQPLGHQRAGQVAVDEQRAMDLSLDAAPLQLVVENQLVAQGAGWAGEVIGGLVGVGAVDGEDTDRQAEWEEALQGGDRVRADALVRGVDGHAERQLREVSASGAGLTGRWACGSPPA
ncbi:hypothetical protein [Spongiactinospora sp. 9N601]|uniref:hypothetical protein n=1 Tax=Spongiactinospora sp. 9N601 TaxID=3375149 RepID=UPI00378C7A3D